VRINVKGTPEEHQLPKTGRNKRNRGDIKQVKTTIQQKELYYTAWMDNKPVHILSSFSAGVSVVKREVKVGGRYR
jgi:hypothetical protein